MTNPITSPTANPWRTALRLVEYVTRPDAGYGSWQLGAMPNGDRLTLTADAEGAFLDRIRAGARPDAHDDADFIAALACERDTGRDGWDAPVHRALAMVRMIAECLTDGLDGGDEIVRIAAADNEPGTAMANVPPGREPPTIEQAIPAGAVTNRFTAGPADGEANGQGVAEWRHGAGELEDFARTIVRHGKRHPIELRMDGQPMLTLRYGTFEEHPDHTWFRLDDPAAPDTRSFMTPGVARRAVRDRIRDALWTRYEAQRDRDA